MNRKFITDTLSVSGQIMPDDLAVLKEKGVVTIINNRPDGEQVDQPIQLVHQIELDAFEFEPIRRDVSGCLGCGNAKNLESASLIAGTTPDVWHVVPGSRIQLFETTVTRHTAHLQT